MQDQRVYLKVKIKSLAEEARIIRKEELRPHADMDECGYSPERIGLHSHRTGIVRSEARAALLAYGFIRGRKYRQLEAKCEFPPDWKRVEQLVLKYGLSPNPSLVKKSALQLRFKSWRGEKAKKA